MRTLPTLRGYSYAANVDVARQAALFQRRISSWRAACLPHAVASARLTCAGGSIPSSGSFVLCVERLFPFVALTRPVLVGNLQPHQNNETPK